MTQSHIQPLSPPSIEHLIYVIRDQKVMLDRDLSNLYGVTNKRLSEQIRRNRNKFPHDFMFELDPSEVAAVQAHHAAANISTKSRHAPRAFTEHGVLMIANVLNSERANQMSIQIVRAFTQLRKLIADHADIMDKLHTIDQKLMDNDAFKTSVYQDIKHLYDAVWHLFERDTATKHKEFGFRAEK
ncbi:MAG: ORF6N domain-containing protein [Candidatus Marinamargulisbacteria bacterium]|nr:DNA-binding protein [bacterium]MDG2265181.1 ORF6N domain-containing protein [Candidatus Marinamargulisbacteria bacterium]